MKKLRISLLIFLIVFILSNLVFAETKEEVYVIPIKGEINRATYNFLNDTLNKLTKKNVQGIIFEIDTYGGLIDQAEKIKNLIVSLNVPTISYVNNKAESAGVLITIASEKIVMSPTATIGSAETIPNTEKVLSMWRSFLRDTAQYRGRDSDIIEAMADKDMYIEGVSEIGKLVNLTSKEAMEHGIADFISDDYKEIIAYFDIENTNIVKVEEGLQIKLAKYISNPYVSSLLLTLGFVGLIVEILTPGFGIGGTISIIGFGLYFGGNILAGNSNWTSLALFVTGLILLVIEGMVPGFGLPGISGIILVLAGTILAMESLSTAILSLSVAIIITTIATIILLKLGFRSKIFNKIILTTHQKDEKGYLSVDSKDEYLDKEGLTVSELRPTGFIEIDGKRLDALSEEGFIPRDIPIKVARVEGSKIFVRRL
ncbi:nodulation protein NfeD [Tissierella sp. MSJ-40]|uniref:Nodulation protein NfeD n=1 Tax=Tissierella simiarum TaxID=2841534 RepID=A0ABS6E7P5_9FIRM|nr:NfeD family protein [Tissierella simiarum]MBU5438264.1 nodulation protein NfeD [Tissierella simiarum]